MEAFSRAIDGGLDIAVEQHFGAETVWHAEFEDAPSKVLAHHWPGVPNHHDVSLVDWSAVEPVDILTGGFPCQDVSLAGRRAGMTEGTRSNLWGAMRTAIETIRPQYAVIENVRGLLSATANSDLESCPGCVGDTEHREHTMRALGRVLGDLADIGYDAQWYGLRAADIGAPHGRYRIFIVATNTRSAGPQRQKRGSQRRNVRQRLELDSGRTETPADTESRGRRDAHTIHQRQTSREVNAPRNDSHAASWSPGAPTQWGDYEPAIRRWEQTLGRIAPPPTELSSRGRNQLSPAFVEWMMGLNQGHVTNLEGISRAKQLKMLGNGVVPQQALAALQIMTERLSRDQAA